MTQLYSNKDVKKNKIKYIWSNVSFKSAVSLLIFCLYGLSIDVNGVLQFPTIIILLLISPFKSITICFIYLGAPLLGAYTFTNVTASYWIDPFVIM